MATAYRTNWMVQYFGHATGQAGDLSRAQDDVDGDGVSNLAEYSLGLTRRIRIRI